MSAGIGARAAVSTHRGEPAGPAGAEELRRLFRRHAAGVSVITATYDGQPTGLLVTSLASVSSEPPLIVFNVSLGSSSWPALAEAEHIGVHVLSASQAALADRFARKGADRFAPPTVWHPGEHGVPLIDGSSARAIARVEQRVPVADHVLVIARLLTTDVPDSAPQDHVTPLLHHDGAYHQVYPLHGADDVHDRAEKHLTVVRDERNGS